MQLQSFVSTPTIYPYIQNYQSNIWKSEINVAGLRILFAVLISYIVNYFPKSFGRAKWIMNSLRHCLKQFGKISFNIKNPTYLMCIFSPLGSTQVSSTEASYQSSGFVGLQALGKACSLSENLFRAQSDFNQIIITLSKKASEGLKKSALHANQKQKPSVHIWDSPVLCKIIYRK